MTLEEGKRDKYRLSLGGIAAPKDNAQIQSERFKKPPDALEEFLKNHPEIKEIEICTDNDFAGRWAKEQMKNIMRERIRLSAICRKKKGQIMQTLRKKKSRQINAGTDH